MNRVALVVMAAGRGERFGGLKQLAEVGPNGEALMDYAIHHALAAGFDEVFVVVRAEIQGPVKDHLRRTWGERLPISYAQQPSEPDSAGTAHAVLSARGLVGDRPFVVINADDLYPRAALGALHGWLAEAGSSHALVAFPLIETFLSATTTGSRPVSRAICDRRPDGTLGGIVEAAVDRRDGSFLVRPHDGGEPNVVGADQLVSMNAFGFRPSVWPALDRAVRQAGGPAGELPLPVMVAGLLDQLAIVVLPMAERCVGLTWPTDLPLLQQDVRRRIRAGELPSRLRAFRP